MPRVRRLAMLPLLALGSVACNSNTVLLMPRDGGAGSSGASGASGTGGSSGGSSGASGGGAGGEAGTATGLAGSAAGGKGGQAATTGGASGAGESGTFGTGGGGAAGTGGSGGASGIGGGGGASGTGGGGTVGTGGSGASGSGGSGGQAGGPQCGYDPTIADCTSAPGCETMLGTDTDCAGCGDRSCAIANTLATCTSANDCTGAICAVGYANCDRRSPDCEAVIAGGATCAPAYRGSLKYLTFRYGSAAAAIAADGSFFFGGAFIFTLDFGTPAAPDVRMPASGDQDGFITKFNADGSYAWTRTFPNSGGVDIFGRDAPVTINALAATADGGVVAVGSYSGTIDLDPGDAVEMHQAMGFGRRESYLVKLAADGSFASGGTFAMQGIDAFGDAGAVATDAAGAVYVSGWFGGGVDLDPTAGVEVHSSYSSFGAVSSGMLVKLTAAGKLAWVRSSDTGACVPSGGSITLATDGTIWIAGGNGEGSSCLMGSVIAAYRPDGTLRGSWGFEPAFESSISFRSIAAGPNGSVYVGGSAWGLPDFDPGPGVARRLVGAFHPGGLIDPGGFILKLGSDGTYLWDRTLTGGDVIAVAGAPGGGVVALGSLGVTKLDADGTAGWTFNIGQFPGTVVSSGNSFAVTGSVNYETDLNPGPGADIALGGDLYLSRFTF